MSVGSSTVKGVERKIVAGEPAEVLLAAFRQMELRRASSGTVRLSATLSRELGEPLLRALTWIERELLDLDRSRGGGGPVRTTAQRRADALVVLAERLTQALNGNR